MGRTTRRKIATTLLLIFTSTPLQAAGESPATGGSASAASLSLRVEGSCPAADEVRRELAPLLEHWTVTTEPEAEGSEATLLDRGESMEVSVNGDVRHFSDPERDCTERARAAAVVIALRLEPPGTSRESVEPTPPPEPEPAEAPPPPQIQLEFGVGALLQKSLDAPLGAGVGPFGFSRLRRGNWTAQLSFGLQTATEYTVQDVLLRFQRFPLDAGFGWAYSVRAWTFEPLVLLAFDYFVVRSPELESAEVQGRFELGPRVGLRVERDLGKVHAFALVDATWFPRDYLVTVDPVGTVTTTPQFWFGAKIGLGVPVL